MSDDEAAQDEIAALAQRRVGQTLCGKYRVDRVLGVGGMACVYAATHRNGRQVAVKLLHPELSIRADLRKRFLLEGHAANAVKHPGVVAVIDDDVVAEDGAAFLVMELLEGQSIEELWRESGGCLPAKTVLAIAREVCDVLIVAHAAGVIHRDLKPANLFLTAGGQVKVLDFGLARARDAITPGGATLSATATGLVFGTPAFLPPEQAAGRTSQIDGKTDLWALGATMFTLLSGTTVHEGESAQNLVMLAATRPPRSLTSVMPEADAAVVHVVDRALAFEKERRWESALEMRREILNACIQLFGEPKPSLSGGMSDTLRVADAEPALRVERIQAKEKVSLVGTKTSQPVSSSATTRRFQRTPRDLVRQVRAAIRGAIASIPMSTTMWNRQVRVGVGVGVGVAIGVGTALFVALSVLRTPSSSPNKRDPLMQTPPSPPAATAAEPSPQPQLPVPETTTSIASAVSPYALPSSSSSSSSKGGSHPRLGHSQPTPSSLSSSRKLDCNPPFTLKDGIQIHKIGCP